MLLNLVIDLVEILYLLLDFILEYLQFLVLRHGLLLNVLKLPFVLLLLGFYLLELLHEFLDEFLAVQILDGPISIGTLSPLEALTDLTVTPLVGTLVPIILPPRSLVLPIVFKVVVVVLVARQIQISLSRSSVRPKGLFGRLGECSPAIIFVVQV